MLTALNSRLDPAAAVFCPVWEPELVPAAAEFYPKLGLCHGKHINGDEICVSRCQLQRTGGSGRRGLEQLHSPREIKKRKARRESLLIWQGKIETEKGNLARKIRGRNRSKRSAKQRAKRVYTDKDRASSYIRKFKVATCDVRTLSVMGKNGARHAEVVLNNCRAIGCDVIGLQEKRRRSRTVFAAAGYRVSCCEVEGGKGRAGHYGFGLAVKESTIVKATWTQALISKCLVSMTLNLASKSNADTFVIAYASTDTT